MSFQNFGSSFDKILKRIESPVEDSMNVPPKFALLALSEIASCLLYDFMMSLIGSK